MPTIQETIDFIRTAHGGQLDKTNNEYYFHPIMVLHNLPAGVSDDIKHAALLHDVPEDTDYRRIDLEKRGYSKETLDIVDLLTKQPDKSYRQMIRAIIDSGNIGAILVKDADIRHNSSLERLSGLDAQTRHKLEKKYGMPEDASPKILLAETAKKLCKEHGYEYTASEQSRAPAP